MALKYGGIIALMIMVVLIAGCTQEELNTGDEIESVDEILPEEDKTVDDNQIVEENGEEAPPTCAEIGGECTENRKCSGIHFDADREVSDCPGRCCQCCKQIIPWCVPDRCCHASSCVLVQWGPDCDDVVCSEECREGTMDCGCGKCEFDRDAPRNCKIVWENKAECKSTKESCCDECLNAYSSLYYSEIWDKRCVENDLKGSLSDKCKEYFSKNIVHVDECWG